MQRHLESTRDLDVSLSPQEVGVWLIQPNQRLKGAVVAEVPIDDSSLYSSGFDHATLELYYK